jgi:dynactin 1
VPGLPVRIDADWTFSPLQTYLPQVFFELDADAAHCVLFFDRLAQKTALINTVVGQAAGLPEALHTAASETLAGTCEVRVFERPLSLFPKETDVPEAMLLR